VALSASDTSAKPKQLYNGCTAEQIQSPAAAECVKQLNDDLMHNRATTHNLYCSSTGRMLCCQYDAQNQVVDHSCDVLTRISHPLPGITDLNTIGPSVGN